MWVRLLSPAWTLGLYNGVDTHKMYRVFTHRIRGQENIVLAPARGQVTGGWTLIAIITHTHHMWSPPGLRSSLTITLPTGLCHTLSHGARPLLSQLFPMNIYVLSPWCWCWHRDWCEGTGPVFTPAVKHRPQAGPASPASVTWSMSLASASYWRYSEAHGPLIVIKADVNFEASSVALQRSIALQAAAG